MHWLPFISLHYFRQTVALPWNLIVGARAMQPQTLPGFVSPGGTPQDVAQVRALHDAKVITTELQLDWDE
jgi:hypothetical protein